MLPEFRWGPLKHKQTNYNQDLNNRYYHEIVNLHRSQQSQSQRPIESDFPICADVYISKLI